MATIPMNNDGIQMSTPLHNLPLKTAGEDTSLLVDDPAVNSVLKDFEKYQQPDEVQQPQPIYPNIPHVQQPMYVSQEKEKEFESLTYKSSMSSLFDYEIVKNTAVIVLIVAVFYNTSLLEKVITNMPEYVKSRIVGKETYVLLILLFVTLYVKAKYLSS